jgi:adenylate cyclase
MMSVPAPALHTIAFIDIVGSTRLYETAGDDLAKQLVTAVEAEITRVVVESGGEVVEVVGDEVMCRFDDANAAVLCACCIQDQIERYSNRQRISMSVRIGMHCGPAIIEDGRMFGDSVNVAARMAAIARGRQIITTEQVVNHLRTDLQSLSRRFDEVRVKGKQEPLVIYDLLWRQDTVTSLVAGARVGAEIASLLRLRYTDKTFLIRAPCAGFSIGRDPGSSLVVVASPVSRNHATIEFTRGKFVLVDTSTNGTYVLTHDRQALYLRRETLPLWGQGLIGLGAPASEDNPDVVRYLCRSAQTSAPPSSPAPAPAGIGPAGG